MTKTQKRILELAKRMHSDGVTKWDLQMRGISISAADALVNKGHLTKVNDVYHIPQEQ
ncbi:hypothetical protein PP187_gp271 [Klebsiella phage vB_KvM-Eowyn]|uniref:Uncharacterized protein n=1 Tax=Klebsiella phage vB_KvM-Eowyn TaxID=2762819 RepID=A0A7R8R5I9_9CAUD|nr:hypothetical protein PP187_gp271 [Klebsiella phage vB_KvM-Eowyn]CAD5236260.1 hypothetical protein LLCLJKAH_00271 [Klebsiella phage vB_KvM-Eowyn]